MASRAYLLLTAGLLAAGAIPACSSSGGGAKRSNVLQSSSTASGTNTQNDSGSSLPPCSSTTGNSSSSSGSGSSAASGTSTSSSLASGTSTSTGLGSSAALELLGAGTVTGTGTSSGAGSETGYGGSSTGSSSSSSSGSGGFAAIQSIVENKCATCHNGNLAPTNYSSESGWDADASNIATQINSTSEPMPPKGSPALTSAEKQELLTYVGLLSSGGGSSSGSNSSPCASGGGSASSSSGSGVSGTGTSTGAGMGSTTSGTGTGGTPGMTTPTGPNAAFFQTFFNPPELAQCQGEGHIYNRATSTCETTQSLDSSCTYASLGQKYGQVGASTLSQYQSAGYVIDQCGTDSSTGAYVAYFICVTESGSASCVQPSQANGATAQIQVYCINTQCH